MSTDKWFALATIFPCSPSGHNFSLLPKHLLYPHRSEDQDLCAHWPRCYRDDVTLWATGAPLSVLQVHTLSLHHGVSCERSHIQERQRPSFILCLRQRQPCTTFTEQRGGGLVPWPNAALMLHCLNLSLQFEALMSRHQWVRSGWKEHLSCTSSTVHMSSYLVCKTNENNSKI